MICRALAIVFVCASAIGCSSGSYTLTVQEKQAPSAESAGQLDVVAVVDRAAMGNGFFRIATPKDLDVRLRSYRADVKGNEPGTVYVNLNHPRTEQYEIVMKTSPGSDYPAASAFRSQVKRELKRLLPDAAVRGF